MYVKPLGERTVSGRELKKVFADWVGRKGLF